MHRQVCSYRIIESALLQAAWQLCMCHPVLRCSTMVWMQLCRIIWLLAWILTTNGRQPCAQGYPPRHQTGSPLPPGYGYPAAPPAPALQNGVHSGFAAFDSPAAVAAARPTLGGGSLF